MDAVQALLLTLKMVGADLYTSEEAKNHALQWLDGLPNVLGFPVADAIKDIVPEGEDS
ncbi:MAG: hypothetical protein KF774_06955 [Planctomyces sp.]|nr:hypothetical protein [Planctomyces sp.]